MAQTLSGFDAVLKTGERLHVRPAPRRAVGPDLSALFVGAQGEVGHIESATVSVHRQGATPARRLPFHAERNSPLSAAEQSAWQRLVRSATTQQSQ